MRRGEQTSQRFDVTIAGELNLDLILYGLPQVMPVEREVIASGFQMTLGSSSAIVAHNLAMLGSKVGFVTRVGADEMGRIALARLGKSGVDLSEVRSDAGASGTGVTVLLPHGEERHMLTYLGTIPELTVQDLPIEYLGSSRHFHLSSLYLQRGLHTGLVGMLESLKQAGLTVSLDTNDDPAGTWGGVLDEVLDFVDVLLPSEGELIRMTRTVTLDDALMSMGERVPLIVVKCGSRGAVVQEGDRREAVLGISVVPVDTIGAGDSFNAGFLSEYVKGASATKAARMGNIAGALSTQASGGTEAFRDAKLRDRFLAQHRG